MKTTIAKTGFTHDDILILLREHYGNTPLKNSIEETERVWLYSIDVDCEEFIEVPALIKIDRPFNRAILWTLKQKRSAKTGCMEVVPDTYSVSIDPGDIVLEKLWLWDNDPAKAAIIFEPYVKNKIEVAEAVLAQRKRMYSMLSEIGGK